MVSVRGLESVKMRASKMCAPQEQIEATVRICVKDSQRSASEKDERRHSKRILHRMRFNRSSAIEIFLISGRTIFIVRRSIDEQK
jgi:hypothetical protein